jgi:glycosyltransferase involved in cell wall biosynthesis
VRRFPKVKFLLVGDGPWRERFENLARRTGLEKNFVFTGLVPPREVPRYVGIMDLLVHLSRREGLPRALPQALAAGKPVVAYDCDGASEVCHDGQTGFLVRPGDLATLEGRLSQLAAEPGARTRLGETGRAYVRELFSVQHMVDALDELYVDLSRRHLPGATRGKSL